MPKLFNFGQKSSQFAMASETWEALASASLDELTEPQPPPWMGGGFDVHFVLPFARSSVWTELLAEYPLGSSMDRAQHTILRPGYTEGEVVSPGCVRRAEFVAADASGYTISELVEADAGHGREGAAVLKWRQLETSTALDLLGCDGHLPEFTVRLLGGDAGTLVTLAYNFASVRVRGGLCCIACLLPRLLKANLDSRMGGAWLADMRERKYAEVESPNFPALLSDKTEEETIRKAAIAAEASSAAAAAAKREEQKAREAEVARAAAKKLAEEGGSRG